ncbi:hypothetical protein RchiOBHm_Chr6g0301071 [Rosa chinensis]|uniref:Uncharacterized protein n=1 Tax=Rosa chinensis TaxID=74649 RepID=A0A2P6PYL8_ROSCH|nr:hypothetical protein RchiOBHm_Chr6g0301071 [Rosa chinensis]
MIQNLVWTRKCPKSYSNWGIMQIANARTVSCLLHWIKKCLLTKVLLKERVGTNLHQGELLVLLCCQRNGVLLQVLNRTRVFELQESPQRFLVPC